jgi:hypothetical protein
MNKVLRFDVFDRVFRVFSILSSGKIRAFRLVRHKISTDSDFSDEALEPVIFAGMLVLCDRSQLLTCQL